MAAESLSALKRAVISLAGPIYPSLMLVVTRIAELLKGSTDACKEARARQ